MDNWRLKHLYDLLEQGEDQEFILFALAQEYTKLLQFEKAKDYYLKLEHINPDYVGLYYHLAQTYIDLDETEKALKCYEKGIETARRIGDHHALGELMNAKTNFELEI